MTIPVAGEMRLKLSRIGAPSRTRSRPAWSSIISCRARITSGVFGVRKKAVVTRQTAPTQNRVARAEARRNCRSREETRSCNWVFGSVMDKFRQKSMPKLTCKASIKCSGGAAATIAPCQVQRSLGGVGDMRRPPLVRERRSREQRRAPQIMSGPAARMVREGSLRRLSSSSRASGRPCACPVEYHFALFIVDQVERFLEKTQPAVPEIHDVRPLREDVTFSPIEPILHCLAQSLEGGEYRIGGSEITIPLSLCH